MEANLKTSVKTKRNIILGTSIVVLLIVIFLMIYVIGEMSSNKVHSGVTVNGINVSDLSKDQLETKLKEELQDGANSKSSTLKSGDYTLDVNFKDAHISYDIDTCVNMAYTYGRTGSVLNQIKNIFFSSKSQKSISVIPTYDDEFINKTIDTFYDNTYKDVKQASFTVKNNTVTLIAGVNGQEISKDEYREALIKSITNCEEEVIEFDPIAISPDNINVDTFYKRINTNAQDAHYIKNKKGNLVLIKQKAGISIDKEDLTKAADKINSGKEETVSIKASATKPKVYAKELKKKLFRDTLASRTSILSSGGTYDVNRTKNVSLAASEINGTILLPGEVFSFNEVVGPRTEEAGYLNAYVYENGEVVPGLAGGICQVSSTLYNAVLYADLKVVERTNHMFTVSYVAIGTDATVAYDSGVDFKFENDTNMPIKLNVSVSGNYLTFSLIGTKTENKVVEITSNTIKTIPKGKKYYEDSSLKYGTEVLKSVGHDGYVVETYKKVSINGKVISNEKISTSTYSSLDDEYYRNSKKPTPTPTPKKKKKKN